MRDLTEAIANLIAATSQAEKIPLSKDDGENETEVFIKHVSIEQAHGSRGPDLTVRLSDGQCWHYIPVRVGTTLQMTDTYYAKEALTLSFRRFYELGQQAGMVQQIAASIEADLDLAHQAWYEQLSDEDTAHWDRWVSGGYASVDEYRLVTRTRDALGPVHPTGPQ
jgi:hypothetical protein